MEVARFRIGEADIVIHKGDISLVTSDVMIATSNCKGALSGGIVRAKHPARSDVLFVVVDLQQRTLAWILDRALHAASQRGHQSVSLTVIRTRIMLGMVESDARAAVEQIGLGLRNFLLENQTSLREIHFVIYGNPEVLQLMVSGSIAEA